MKSRYFESYLSVHPTLGLVAELEEEGVVSPPGEGARTVNPRADEHGVTEGRHQLAPGRLRLRDLLGINILVRSSLELGDIRGIHFAKCCNLNKFNEIFG